MYRNDAIDWLDQASPLPRSKFLPRPARQTM
jgi:hypothetical protein